MFNRFFIKTCNFSNQRYLLNTYNSIRLSKINFSNGRGSRLNTRKFKKIEEKRITMVKNKGKNNNKEKFDSKSNNSQPQGDKDVKVPKIPLSRWFGGGFIVFGAMELFSEISRVNKLRVVSYEEFEQEYLLHGEVRAIVMLGIFGKFFTGCASEVHLHFDDKRKYQKIAINDENNRGIVSQIRQKEKDLNINPKEAVQIAFNFSDMFLLYGLILTLLSFRGRLPPRIQINKTNPSIFKMDETTKKEYETLKKEAKKDFETFTRELKSFKTSTKSTKRKKSFMDSFGDYLDSNLSPKEELQEKSFIKFKDVAGLHSAKIEVKEFVDYLNNPSKFIRLGARLPRGAMLLGPPGCGKTLLVKALANESNVPFYYKSGPEFVDMIGGRGAKRMRNLFSDARENAPAIIFIDEIDAIGKTRGSDAVENSDADQTLNQLLVEMDGMESVAGVVVFAATNRPDVLDLALTRPGRLDRHILIDLPVLEERKELFDLYLNKFQNKLESTIKILTDRLALQTPGMSGADIANVCNEAALTAARLDYHTIKDECFDIALERIIAGAAKKSKFLSEAERKIVAYHEAGHVIVGWILKYADPILKVSIVPRTNAALGFSQLDMKDKYLLHNEMLTDKIAVLLGGRAAESIIFNKITSGAQDDLKKVKKLAFSMIREWGMSEKIGHFSFKVTEEDEARGKLPYSKHTQELIETEANNIVVSAYKRAEKLIKENIEKLETIALELLKKEMLVYKDIELLIGPRPHSN